MAFDNFKWYSRILSSSPELLAKIKINDYKDLSSNQLVTRISGKSFSLKQGSDSLANFEIDEISATEILGQNVTIFSGDLNATILRFISSLEAKSAFNKINIALNGGVI